jgi:predicted nucleic acid binding AN1-type Zn finger protein
MGSTRLRILRVATHTCSRPANYLCYNVNYNSFAKCTSPYIMCSH